MNFESLSKEFITLHWFALSDRGFIHIQGSDAEKFLQGQLTCDVSLAKNHAPQLCAHCNLKGRILFTCHLFYGDGDYLLVMPKSQVETAIRSLKKYAVFSKVEIQDVSETITKILKTLEEKQESLNVAAWKQRDILSGIAEIYPETQEQFTPHELNYHELNAISFDKGCYIGQEIVARMHYRGKLKNHLIHARGNFKQPPRRGEKIFYCKNQQQDEFAGYIVDFAIESDQTYHLLISLSINAMDNDLLMRDTLEKIEIITVAQE